MRPAVSDASREFRRRGVGVCLAALLVLLPSPAAQAQSATGSIEGLLVDQSSAVLPGASIAIVESATGVERRLITDERGLFRAPILPVGSYELTATLAGFEPARQTGVRLGIGQTITVRLELRVAGVAERVMVAGAQSIAETSRSHASATVNELAVRNLPVNGRNFIDFVLLTPGVTRDVRTGDISFAGQRGTLNSLIVDGADNNHTFSGQTLGRTGSGRAPYQFSQDAVQEFQVNSNGLSAEYGRAGAAVINVVTKSGTNRLSGSLFDYYRDTALNAANPINEANGQPKSSYHYHQFGGVLGGPLRSNRDFFFFNYDGQRNTQPNLVFLNLPSSTPDDAATAAGIALLRPLASSWSRSLDQDVFLIKTDHQLDAAHRLTVRYNHQDFRGAAFENFGPQVSLEHTGASLVQTRTLNASWAGVFRRTMFNELRFQYARDFEPGDANSDNPEAVVQQGGTLVLLIGRNNFSPRENTIGRLQLADTLTWMRGAHQVKTGFDVQFDRIDNVFPGFFAGSYTFTSLASFARGRPEIYRQSFAGAGTGGAVTRPNVSEYSLFVQDEWKPRADLTLNLGLRYDLMNTDAPGVRNPDLALAAAGIDTSRLDADTNNLAPRLGIVWSPKGRSYVLRGAWAVMYGRTPSSLATAAGSNNGISVVSLTFTGDAVPTYPQKFTDMPAAVVPARPSIVYIDKDFANPRLMHANAAFEWELLRDTSLTLTYLFVDGTDLPRSIDRNVGPLGARTLRMAESGAAVSAPFFAPGPFGSFQRVIAFESSAESRYHGLTVELNRRFAGGLQFRAAYTLGRVEDTVPDATAILPGNAGDDAKFASNPADFEVDRAAGSNDQRHRFVASGVYVTDAIASRLDGVARALTGGWTFSAIVTAQSGQPYSARVAGDLNGDGNMRNDLAPGTRRNDFRLPSIVTLDPRIARDVPLAGRVRAQLIGEAFNLFNRDNINGVDRVRYALAGTTLSPSGSFGRPIASAGERIMQLAVKLTF